MEKLEAKAVEVVKNFVPNFEKLEFRADIGNTSYIIEFFVQIDGKRWQCYSLVDDGKIDEEEMDKQFAMYAEYVRSSGMCKDGDIIIEFTV